MAEVLAYKSGDRVVHPRRPEWGEGVVDRATAIAHEGRPAQRLVVRFAHHGLVTINTGVAPLLPKDKSSIMSGNSSSASVASPLSDSPRSASAAGWLDSLEGKATGTRHELWRLPDAMTDPFLGVEKRLQATLEAYRFTPEPRHLLDWAISQTSLHDPLSKYTRSELEQAFHRFARDRDQHLQDLVRLLKKGGQAQVLRNALDAVTKNPRTPGREALQRAVQRA